jgi:hypothetical protein
MPRSVTALPLGVYLISGSRVTFPMSITLLRLAIGEEVFRGLTEDYRVKESSCESSGYEGSS